MIIGIIAIFGGISIVVIVAYFSFAPISLTENNNRTITESVSPQLKQLFGTIGPVAGAVFLSLLAIGIGYIVMSYGLLKGKGWGRTITIILVIIGIGLQVLSAITGPVFIASIVNTDDADASNSLIAGIICSIIGIAISILIQYYLYRRYVKTYFGKTQQQ
jgi:protein-S-isoprenylcysteine O-methyltransferase Ste14